MIKKPLTTITTKFNLVISAKNENLKRLEKDLKTYCNNAFERYAFILHDKDNIIDDNGIKTAKTPHFHIVGITKTRKRLSTMIYDISNSLNISNQAVSIDKLGDETGAIQYLIHLNDTDKTKYNVSSIITNIEQEELAIIMATKNDALTIDRLIDIVQSAKNRLEIMQRLGLAIYAKYRNVINDILLASK